MESTVRANVVKEFLLKGLAANIDDRFSSVKEMADAFRSVKHELLK
jgi:hypothetical protein